MFHINNIISHLLAFVKKEFCKMSEKTERKENPWARLPLELVEQYGFTIAGMYAVLLDTCPRGTTTVTIKQRTLAKKCKMSLASVKRTLNELEKLGLVKKTRNFYASTYEIKPVIRLKGEWQQDEQKEQVESEKRRCRKKSFRTPEEEQERQIKIDKYLDLVN